MKANQTNISRAIRDPRLEEAMRTLAESAGTYPNRDRANLPIDDYVGRYEECYAIYADQQAALLEDLNSGKITGPEFDELWEEIRVEFEVCREVTDSDHDMFEEKAILGLPF